MEVIHPTRYDLMLPGMETKGLPADGCSALMWYGKDEPILCRQFHTWCMFFHALSD
jgi:hypothetical protein